MAFQLGDNKEELNLKSDESELISLNSLRNLMFEDVELSSLDDLTLQFADTSSVIISGSNPDPSGVKPWRISLRPPDSEYIYIVNNKPRS